MDAHVALEESPQSPVDELVEARFAFTDPRGRVTRWGEGAEELFGIPAEQIVGQPLFEVALVGADGGWQGFLTEEGAQCPSSRLEVSVNRTDGQVFPCVVHLVPVLLADGLDFSQFAADLGLDHGDSLDSFKERHQRVLGMIESAARDGAQYAEGERLAGLIATFRPSGDGPVTTGERIDEALTRAERAEREVEDLRDPLTQVAAEFADLRAGLEGVRERIEALEVRAGKESGLQAAVAALETSLGERVGALEGRPEVDVEGIATEIERKLSERLDRALAERIDEVLPARIEDALGAHVDGALPGHVERAVSGQVEQALPGHVEPAVSGLVEETLPGHVERMLGGHVERALGGHVEHALQGHVERAVSVRAAEQALPADFEETLTRRIERALEGRMPQAPPADLEEIITRRVEEAVARRVEEATARRIDEALPARIEEAVAGRVDLSRADAPDEGLEGRIEEAVATRIEQTVARRIEEALEEVREARVHAEQMAHDLLARRPAASRPLPVGFYASEGGPDAPDRPPVADFDDVSAPLAMLSLDGRFTHLNPAFRDLLGYSEEEFSNARWPSPAFTEHLGSQRELRRALAAGEIDEHQVETAYMHREGLLIPLVGRMALVRNDEGVPDHLLFSVGAP